MQTALATLYPQIFTAQPARSFMKWAGGKGQLIRQLAGFFPPELQAGAITKYAEPFIGGGAMFFYIAQNYPNIKAFFISDINEELILAYLTIQKDVDGLIDELRKLETRFHALDKQNQKDYFYRVRTDFNAKLSGMDFKKFHGDWIQRAAEIIFLNRTCFNGLFRVNSKGEFNVPFGDYDNPKICDAENLRAVASLLQRTEIVRGDFALSKKFIGKKTFVYFDPPYRPISKTANFTTYSKYEFGEEAQKRLASYFGVLSKKGAKVMLSNSDPKNEDPQDHFFEDLYQAQRIERVDAARMINCDGSKRGKIKELVIVNY